MYIIDNNNNKELPGEDLMGDTKMRKQLTAIKKITLVVQTEGKRKHQSITGNLHHQRKEY